MKKETVRLSIEAAVEVIWTIFTGVIAILALKDKDILGMIPLLGGMMKIFLCAVAVSLFLKTTLTFSRLEEILEGKEKEKENDTKNP